MGKKKRKKPNHSNSQKENQQPKQPPSSPPLVHSDSKVSVLKQAWFWAVIFFLVSLGFPIIFPNTDSAPIVYLGWIIWGLALASCSVGFWQQFAWNRWIKGAIVVLATVLFLFTAHRSITDRLRPSFTFLSPGVLLNGDTWDFIVNHRGPKTSYSIQILFIDKDRANFLTKIQQSLTPADLSSYQVLWSLPEVNPKGRGSIFAQQLVWKPFNLEHSHFTAQIKWRDGSVNEDLEIVKVQEKWQYAMTITDPETTKALLRCHDKDFPSNEPLPSCFPSVTLPAD